MAFDSDRDSSGAASLSTLTTGRKREMGVAAGVAIVGVGLE